MKINSRSKGKNGELELVHLLRDNGFEAKRGQQFAGSPDTPDVVHNIPNVHIEVKRVEKLNIDKALDQAIRDCGDKMPTVWHRKNRTDWKVTLLAKDFISIIRRLI